MTKEKFEKYVDIQESGYTNMFDVATVVLLSGHILTREDCLDIMGNYEKYEKQYGGV